MKKTLVLILVLLIAIAYGAQITSISPSFQDGQVIFRIDTDANLTKDNIFVEKNAAGSLVSIHLKNVNLANSPFFLPVAYGPVDSLRAIGTYQGSLVLFQLLIPREPSIEIAGKTLKVAFKGSDKRIDLALTEGSDLETAVKFLSEELNLNVVLSDTVKTAKLALKLSNITPEEALRNLLLTVRIGTEPLAYSYMPDGTLHIGTKKEISQRFAQFWGIYEVSEDIVQKIEKILSPTTIMTYLPNKALLFVYGDTYEQELISKILSVAPPSVTREVAVSVPVEDVSKLLTSLKNVYTFEFNLLEGLDKFIITGDSKTVQTVVSYIMQLEERFKKTKIESPTDQATKTTEAQTQSKQLKVIYPQEASKILENIGLQVIELPFGVLEINGSETQLQLAEAVLRDLGFTEKIQVEPLDIPKPIQEKVISALSTVFGVPVSRFVDLQDGLFIIAPLEIRNAIRSIASELTRFYYTLKQSEVFFLNDEQTATQVSQILNQIYGIESITVQNILKVTGSEEDLNKTKAFLRNFVKDRLIRTVDIAFDDQTYTEVKTLIESTLDVRIEANLKSLRRVIISSYNQEDLQKAVEELQKIYSLIAPITPQKVVKLIPIVQKLSFEDAKLMLSKLYEIELEKTELFYIITGTEEKIREASDFLEGIRKSLQEEETYTIVRVPEGFAVKDISDILSKIAQINIYTADQIMILHGEKKAIEKAQILLDEIQSALPKKPEESKSELVARVLEYKEEIPVDEFQSFLQSIGNTVKISAYPKLGIIVISGTSLDVEKAILEYEKFSEKLKQKIEILKVEAQPIQVRKNNDGTVSIVCDDKSLKEVITAVAQTLGVSLIFVSTPSENITMNVSSMNWEQFKKLIQEQYGYSFVETDSATVFIKPKVEVVVDRTPEQKFIYNLPHNLDKVKSMVEFYGGKVYVDDLKDLIIITGLSAEARERVEQLMVDISKPLKQVEIEARLIDRSLLDSLERSFSFGFSLAGTDTSINLTDGTLNITTNVINMFDYQQLLSLIPKASLSVNANLNDSNTLSNLLASPRIVTSSGQEARILIGDRIPYQTVDAEGNVTVNFLDTGIELKITPYVRMDNTIELSVFTKVSKATYYPNIDIPGESTREAQTKVIIKNGDTLVIGGLIRETDEQTHSKVPILGDLPFIGQLFRTKTDEKDKRELIIFITAKVIEQ